MTTTDETLPPIVCTLDNDELSERYLEWSDLGALALASELIDNGVASTYPVELQDAIEDLAQRENSCCGSWLQSAIAIVPGEGHVRLELTTTNPDGVPVIRSMSGFDQT